MTRAKPKAPETLEDNAALEAAAEERLTESGALEVDPAAAFDEDALGSLLATIPQAQDSRVTVYRTGPNTKRAYLFQCHPAEFNLDKLREEYGGGDFQLYIKRGAKLWKCPTVTIEAPRKPVAPQAQPAPNVAVPDTERTLREFIAQQSQVMQAILGKLTQTQQIPDPLAMVERLSSIMANMRPAQSGGGMGETLTMAGQLVEMVTKLKGEGGGVSEREPGLMDMLMKLVESPVVAQALQNAGKEVATRAALPAPAAPAAPTAPAAPVSTELQGESVGTIQDVMIKHALGQLVGAAQIKVDPDALLDQIYRQTPPAILDTILAKPDPVAFLAEYDQRVSEHKSWFESLLAAIRQDVQAEEKPPQRAGEGEETAPD